MDGWVRWPRDGPKAQLKLYMLSDLTDELAEDILELINQMREYSNCLLIPKRIPQIGH